MKFQRFWSKVKIQRGCWVWKATMDRHDYGKLLVGSRKDGTRRIRRAHRISYEIVRGEIPEGLQVLHKCDNPPCVRPSHLVLGTHKDNMSDMYAKNRRDHKKIGRPGELHHNCKITSEIALEIRRLCADGKSQQEVGELFGLSQTHVGRIVRGERWTHV